MKERLKFALIGGLFMFILCYFVALIIVPSIISVVFWNLTKGLDTYNFIFTLKMLRFSTYLSMLMFVLGMLFYDVR